MHVQQTPPAKSPLKSKTVGGIALLAAAVLGAKFGIPIAPEDVETVLTLGAGLIGAVLGIVGRYKAKRPLKAPQLPLPVFCTVLMPLCVLPAVLSLPGCANGGIQTRDPIDLALVGITTGVLRNNPHYQPLVGDVIARIDSLVERGHTSPALIDSFLAELQAKYTLQAEDVGKIRETIAQVRLAYRAVTGVDFPLAIALDARAEEYLRQVQAALAEGTMWAQLFPNRRKLRPVAIAEPVPPQSGAWE